MYIIFGSGVAVNFYHTTTWAYFRLFQLKTPVESSSIPTVNQKQKISYFSTSRNDKILPHSFIIPLRSKKAGRFENFLVLLGITPLRRVAQWVSRAPPQHTLPAFPKLNGTFDQNNYWLMSFKLLEVKNHRVSWKPTNFPILKSQHIFFPLVPF